MEGEAEAAYAHGVCFPSVEALRTSKTGNQCQRSHGQQSQWHEVSERCTIRPYRHSTRAAYLAKKGAEAVSEGVVHST